MEAKNVFSAVVLCHQRKITTLTIKDELDPIQHGKHQLVQLILFLVLNMKVKLIFYNE